MKHHLMEYLNLAEYTEVISVLPDQSDFIPEHDAMRILNKVRNLYEPVSFF